MKRPPRWIGRLTKPVLIACVIGVFSAFGLADRIAGFSANLGEKDRMVRWSAVLSGATHDAIPVTLIDIDPSTMAALGHPQTTPREVLAGLLALAAAKHAGGIFLDMDTSRPGSPAGDAALAGFLAAYPPDAPPLALARRLGALDQAGASVDALAEQPSLLDATVRGKPNVIWAASVSRIDEDRVVRRWQLSHTSCSPGAGATLPSPQLFAAAVAGAHPRPLSDIQAFADSRTQAVCTPGTAAAAPAWPRNPDQSAAIAFLIPDGPDLAAPQFIARDGRQVPLFRRVPARALMTASGAVVSPQAVADDLLRGRFVIIGASHAESMDGHLTPIGFLPGALIVANAVATAPAVLSGQPVGPIGATLIALTLLGALVAITSRLRPLAAGLVVAVAVLGALMVLGRIFAPSTASDIVLAAFGMVAFLSTAEGIHAIGKDWRARGWRALLKPEKPPAVKPTETIT
ncbi:CHASE2 domain-containing protein [Xanthobacter autotrophicus DSM 431]|uniref:CHASE2 domain-containing protein n=1 Tax=Xanthobacter nonsaccharivorans TaxID=3119912 RepID=UPI0037287C29